MSNKSESHHHTCPESSDHHCPGCCFCECCKEKRPITREEKKEKHVHFQDDNDCPEEQRPITRKFTQSFKNKIERERDFCKHLRSTYPFYGKTPKGYGCCYDFEQRCPKCGEIRQRLSNGQWANFCSNADYKFSQLPVHLAYWRSKLTSPNPNENKYDRDPKTPPDEGRRQYFIEDEDDSERRDRLIEEKRKRAVNSLAGSGTEREENPFLEYPRGDVHQWNWARSRFPEDYPTTPKIDTKAEKELQKQERLRELRWHEERLEKISSGNPNFSTDRLRLEDLRQQVQQDQEEEKEEQEEKEDHPPLLEWQLNQLSEHTSPVMETDDWNYRESQDNDSLLYPTIQSIPLYRSDRAYWTRWHDPNRRLEYIYNRMGGQLLYSQLPCAELYLKCRWEGKNAQRIRENLYTILKAMEHSSYDSGSDVSDLLKSFIFEEEEKEEDKEEEKEDSAITPRLNLPNFIPYSLEECREQYEQCLENLIRDSRPEYHTELDSNEEKEAALNEFYDLVEQVLDDDMEDFGPGPDEEQAPDFTPLVPGQFI